MKSRSYVQIPFSSLGNLDILSLMEELSDKIGLWRKNYQIRCMPISPLTGLKLYISFRGAVTLRFIMA